KTGSLGATLQLETIAEFLFTGFTAISVRLHFVNCLLEQARFERMKSVNSLIPAIFHPAGKKKAFSPSKSFTEACDPTAISFAGMSLAPTDGKERTRANY